MFLFLIFIQNCLRSYKLGKRWAQWTAHVRDQIGGILHIITFCRRLTASELLVLFDADTSFVTNFLVVCVVYTNHNKHLPGVLIHMYFLI